MKNALALIKV